MCPLGDRGGGGRGVHLLCGRYYGCAAPKGHFFRPRFLSQLYIFLLKSLAKGIILTKPLKIGVLGLSYRLFWENFSYQGNIWTKIPQNIIKMIRKWSLAKIRKWSGNGPEMIRKRSLAKGMFFTKFSLAEGFRSKTRVSHPHPNFFGVL